MHGVHLDAMERRRLLSIFIAASLAAGVVYALVNCIANLLELRLSTVELREKLARSIAIETAFGQAHQSDMQAGGSDDVQLEAQKGKWVATDGDAALANLQSRLQELIAGTAKLESVNALAPVAEGDFPAIRVAFRATGLQPSQALKLMEDIERTRPVISFEGVRLSVRSTISQDNNGSVSQVDIAGIIRTYALSSRKTQGTTKERAP